MFTARQISVSTSFHPVAKSASTKPLIVGICDILNNQELSRIERLAEWLVCREHSKSWEHRVDFNCAWPVELPLLVCAATNSLHEDTVAMVGDRAAFLQACERRDANRRLDHMALSRLTRAQLVNLASRETRISAWSRLTKEQIVEVILDARYPMPTSANKDLEQLWQDELAEGQERIRIRRAMVLLEAGSTTIVDGFVIGRLDVATFDVDGEWMDIEEAVRRVRTSQPKAA